MVNKLFFLRALTPLHVGSGRGSSSHVDLPLQRDEFGLPTIWSSSLKGALRAAVSIRGMNQDELKAIFGPEPASPEVSEYSSSLSILDARLVLIPARILKGVWAYVTSPHMLSTLKTYGSLADRTLNVREVQTGKALISRKEISDDGYVTVNEVPIPIEELDEKLIEEFKNILPGELYQSLVSKGLIIVHDSMIRQIINRSIIIQYRVRLKNETKTVEEGPWSEEYLPAESILTSVMITRTISAKDKKLCDSEIFDKVDNALCKIKYSFYVGGKETLGKGLARIYFAW
ncbi:MAG: type III-B CRISPR module RAMP protein Cmr4 [Thermofilaceae archaeon]|nr:type III-B CRISPR module RAMP protein Cmr4 [Thermofilaceae archaeon]